MLRLRDVRSVYVVELGPMAEAKALRQEIVRQLNAPGRIMVVAAPGAADALLSLSVKQSTKNVDWALHPFDDPAMKIGSRVVPVEELVFRLNTQQNPTLLTGKFDAEIDRAQGDGQAGRALGNKLGQGLLKAIEKDSKRRP